MDDHTDPERRIEALAAMLSPEARRVFLGCQASLRAGEDPREMVAEVLNLSPEDQIQVQAGVVELARVYAQEAGELDGRERFAQQARSVISRAAEYDPTVKTVGDAVRVLEAHGEKVGMSREALEMPLEIPTEDHDGPSH